MFTHLMRFHHEEGPQSPEPPINEKEAKGPPITQARQRKKDRESGPCNSQAFQLERELFIVSACINRTDPYTYFSVNRVNRLSKRFPL